MYLRSSAMIVEYPNKANKLSVKNRFSYIDRNSDTEMPNRVFFNDNNPQDDLSAVEDHGSMIAILDRMNSSNMISPA